MTNRKVFIIKGYSKSDDENEVDTYYVNAYKDFFLSNAGGGYFNSEIEVLMEPTSKYLNLSLEKEKLEFGILVYIGHGANQESNQIFQLNETEIIKAGQFTLNCDKQIIILESCRVKSENILTVDLEDKIPKFEKGGIFRIPLNTEQCREIYNSHIKRCEKGLMICFPCRVGEMAYNFIYSKAMIQNAMDWHLDSSRHCAILPIDELTRLAWPETIIAAKGLFGVQQFPSSDGDMNFPIAVSKF